MVELQTNIITVIENAGVRLRKSGKAYTGCCPFHEDKHPSFHVYPDSNRFICYGCGEKGDVVDFIRKLKGFSFRAAVNYLGLDSHGKKGYEDNRQMRRQALIKSFREWCNQYYDQLATEYRCINKTIAAIKTIDQAERYASLYHRLPVLEWCMDILLFGDDQERYFLYKERNRDT